MALSDGLGIQALVQSYDKKAISQAFTEIASQLNKSVDDLNDDLNKIKIDKDVVNNLVNQLKALPEEIRKKTQGMSFDLFSDLINADGAEEKIDKAIETFSNKMKSFVKLRDSIGNDKIIIETDLSDLDELIKKEQQILSLETQIQEMRNNKKRKGVKDLESDVKSKQEEINTWVQARNQIDKYNVDLNETKKNITELANEFRNKKLGSFSFIEEKNIDQIKEMVGWLEKYVQLSGDVNLSGLKDFGIKGGVMDLRELYQGNINTNDSNLRKQYQEYADVVKKYISLNKSVGSGGSGTGDGFGFGASKEDAEELLNTIKEIKDILNQFKDNKSLLDSEEINTLKQRISELDTQISDIQTKFKDMSIDSFDGTAKDANELLNKLEEVYNQITSVQDKLQGLDDNVFSGMKTDIDNLVNKFDAMNDQLQEFINLSFKADIPEMKMQNEVNDNDNINSNFDNSDAIKGQNQLQLELKETNVEAQKVKDSLEEINKTSGDQVTGKVFHGAKTKWQGENFDFSKSGRLRGQLGAGMYFTSDSEKVANFGKAEIKELELSLENCFVITKEYITSISDLYKVMGKELPDNATIKEAMNEMRMYNNSSQENAQSFRKNMLDMGYQGMYVGDNLANKIIPEELVVYDEKKLENLKSFTNDEFKKLQTAGSIEVKIDDSNIEKASNEIKDITQNVNTEGQNKLQSELDETKVKIQEVGTEAQEAKQKVEDLGKTDVNPEVAPKETPTPSPTSEKEQQPDITDSSDTQTYKNLQAAIAVVEQAIKSKTEAIQDEEVQMYASVNGEIKKLEELKGKLNEIKTQFEQGIASGFFKNINSEDVDGNFVNIDLKPTVDANKFKEDAERLLTFVDVEKEVNLKVGELDTSNITDTTSTVTSPVSENIANDNVIEEQNKDLELQQIIYNNIIRLLTEYLSLQDRINAGNKDIANGDLISFNDIRKQTGKVSQRAVKDQLNNYLNISKNENGIYNDDSIKRAKEQLAAYVANFNNAEKSAEIFGNKNKELFNKICQMIDNAKVSLDAYNNAQDSIDVAESQLSELNKLQTGENLTYGQLWDLEKIVKTDGLEAGLKYITDELGIKIPEAAQKAESAIAEVNNELSKPQQKTPSVEGQTGNDQDGKKSDVITVPVEPLLVQKEWEDKIDDILKAIGTKKISIIPDTTSDEWNEFKTFINKISNLTINLNNVTDPKSIAESDLNDSYKRSINAATELYAVEEKIAQAKESNNQQELKKLSTLEAQKKKFEELLKLEEKFRANERFSDIDTSTNDNELKQLRESLEQKYQNNRQTNATNLASNMDNLYDEAAGEYSKKLLQDQLNLQKEIESTKTRIAKLEKDSITSDENELSKNQSEQESLKQKITLLEQSSNQLQNEINQFDQYIDKQQQAVALEEIRIKAEKDRAKLTKNSVDDSNNYARVNNLLKEQEETIRRINVLQTKQDEIGLTDTEQKLLNSLSEKFLSIQEQVTAELNKQYDLTARIADRREKLASNNKLGLNDIGSLDFSGDTNYNASVENINKVVNTIDEAQRKLQSLNNPNANSIYKNEYQKAAQDVQDLTNELLNSQNAASNLNKYVKETDSTINRLSSKQNVVGTFTPGNINAATEAIKRYIQTIDGIDQSTIKWNTNGTRLTATFKDIDGQLRNLIIQANVAEGQFSQTFGSPVKQATTLSKFLDELGVKFRNLSTYLLSFVGFYEVWGAIQQGVTYVRELDSALTEMKKVSDETTESLKAFQEESFDIADSVASTAKEIQNSTADWLRLDYAMDEASELARTTAVYKAVGDDMDIATATESMVSTLQGFQLEADQAANIVDQFNEVSNNFAIDSKGIGDALQRSAASFNAANTGMSEAIALITATNAVLQDPEKVGM